MVFKSSRQRKAVMASIWRRRGGFGQNIAFSYVTGKRIPGKFSSIKDVFKKKPKEKVAFNKVTRFNKRFNTKITNTRQLKDARKRITRFKKQDNPPRKPRKKVKSFVRSIYG